MSETRSWMDGPAFLKGIVLAQLTPGTIVITATFVDYLLLGLLGALIATVAVFLPSYLILVGIAPLFGFDRARSSPWLTRAIGGILCSFVDLLLIITIRSRRSVHWD
jgi:chromate transporter